MTVDKLIAAVMDDFRQSAALAGNIIAAADHGGNPHAPRLLGKGTVPEADQLGGDDLI